MKYSDYSSGQLDLQTISEAKLQSPYRQISVLQWDAGIEAVGRLGMIEAGGKGWREAGKSQGAVLLLDCVTFGHAIHDHHQRSK